MSVQNRTWSVSCRVVVVVRRFLLVAVKNVVRKSGAVRRRRWNELRSYMSKKMQGFLYLNVVCGPQISIIQSRLLSWLTLE